VNEFSALRNLAKTKRDKAILAQLFWYVPPDTITGMDKMGVFLLRMVAIVSVAGMVSEALSPVAAITLGRRWDDTITGALIGGVSIAVVAVVAYITCKK
jgi:hypothetical protein